MRADGVDFMIESDRCSLQRFKRHGAGHIGSICKPLSIEEGQSPDSSHRLSTIQKSQSFLGFENERLDARGVESIGALHSLAAIDSFTFADDHQRKVSQGRQIARCANRSARRYNRMHPGIEHPQQNVNHFFAAPRIAFCKHVRALKHHRAYYPLGKWISDSARVRTNQVDLKLSEFFRRDCDLGKRTKPGVYAVDDFATGDDVFNKAAGLFYAGPGAGGE